MQRSLSSGSRSWSASTKTKSASAEASTRSVETSSLTATPCEPDRILGRQASRRHSRRARGWVSLRISEVQDGSAPLLLWLWIPSYHANELHRVAPDDRRQPADA